jgi:aminopeptidase S
VTSRLAALAVACAALAACATTGTSASPSAATPPPTASPPPVETGTQSEARAPSSSPSLSLSGPALAELVDPEALREHLEAFEAIADGTPGGSRATGSVGFERSLAYVRDRLTASGYEIARQDFSVGGALSANLIAERAGAVDGVLVLGAHLDSVEAGPGINDNASGVAALLVIADRLATLPPPRTKVRFAFWGAEEGGPFGSRAYVDELGASQRREIVAYLNFDMLASPNAVRFVYDEAGAPAGSTALTAAFGDYFDRAGLPWDSIDLAGDSDHGPFSEAAIPTGGLFSGGTEPVTENQAADFGSIAGQPADPCSHRACDTIDNVDLATLTEMTRAIAHVLATLTQGE